MSVLRRLLLLNDDTAEAELKLSESRWSGFEVDGEFALDNRLNFPFSTVTGALGEGGAGACLRQGATTGLPKVHLNSLVSPGVNHSRTFMVALPLVASALTITATSD